MKQVQTQKVLKSVLVLLCLYKVGLSQPLTNKKYQMNLSVTYGGEKLPFGNGELFIVDSLTFEGISTFVDKSISTLQRDNTFSTESITKDSLIKYVVTNLKTKKCFVFSLSNPPKLLQEVPLSDKEKITGQHFKDEAYTELGNSARNFKYIGDTVIENFKYRILENTVSFSIQNIPYHRARAFLNTDLQKFPFHPISAQIDNEFSGFVTRIELYGSDGKAFIINYTVEAIPKEKVVFINCYLELLPL